MKTNPIRLKELEDALAAKKPEELVPLPAHFLRGLVGDLRDALTDIETARVDAAEVRKLAKNVETQLVELKTIMFGGE